MDKTKGESCMEVFVDRISASVGITDVLDILIVAFLIYKVRCV